MGLYSGGLIIGKIFASEIWGAYFREGLFLEGGLLSEFYRSLWRYKKLEHQEVKNHDEYFSNTNYIMEDS